MSDALDDGSLDALEERIDGWLDALRSTFPIEAIDRGEGDERRWFVRLRGEDKDFTTVWLTLGQRTLRYETYDERVRRYSDEILVNMQRRFGYSKESALDTILFALRKRIIDFDEIIS